MIQTIVGVDGMVCEMCEAHINDAVRKAFPVKSVKADRKKKRCVIVSAEPLDEAALLGAIAATGYEPLSVSSEPYKKRGFLPFL